MKKALLVAAAVLVAATGAVAIACHRPAAPPSPLSSGTAGATRMVRFDGLAAGAQPAGFRFAAPGPDGAKPARWEIVAGSGTVGAMALQQSDGDDTNHRYPVALLESPRLADVRVEVLACAISGGRDRSFGAVLRAQDERNYYVARANTSDWGGNVRIYRFVDGKRTELDSWDGDLKPGTWYRLRFEAAGDALVASLDGRPVLRVQDRTFPGAGLAGVWTKAESVSQFAEIAVTPLGR